MSPKSWVEVSPDSHFPIQNLPYGVFSTASDSQRRLGVAIGEQILDLNAASKLPILAKTRAAKEGAFRQEHLNSLMGLGKAAWSEARAAITQLLSSEEAALRDNKRLQQTVLLPQRDARMHLPAQIGDYTDFYTCMEHAKNAAGVKTGFRVLTPSWLHMPTAYHSRSSSVVISGTDVRRPWGQVAPPPSQMPFGKLLSWLPFGQALPVAKPTAACDYELEMACLVGGGNELGQPIPLAKAADHMFGFVLMNDWSARDVQRWEMFPLGPFNSKNFATSISPWVVPLEALEPFRRPADEQVPEVLPYLKSADRTQFDIQLQATVQPRDGPATVTTTTNFRQLYWSFEQMLAHHTYGGCNLRPGDLLGSGTISSPGPGGQGCLMELTWGGANKLELEGGGQRGYLEDGDAVTLSGFCQGDEYRVGFGECTGRLLPALSQT